MTDDIHDTAHASNHATAVCVILATDLAARVAQGADDRERQEATKNDLHRAVQEANDGEMSWQTIAALFGLRRGAAYQRFRRRRGATENFDE